MSSKFEQSGIGDNEFTGDDSRVVVKTPFMAVIEESRWGQGEALACSTAEEFVRQSLHQEETTQGDK